MLMVSFIVEIDGNVSNVKIIRPLCQKADEAVINAVKTMPLWKPGIKNEEYVRVLINMPVRFLLPVKENE
jgi:protein TonB